jgi:hypothetical protein
MPEKPKPKSDETVADDQKERGYYYDDSHGYEEFDPEDNEEEEEDTGKGGRGDSEIACQFVNLLASPAAFVSRLRHPRVSVAPCRRVANLARAFAASTSRSRGGAFVTSELRSSLAASVTFSTARLKASSFAFDGFENPLSFLTNCKDDACTSSAVAGGSKL